MGLNPFGTGQCLSTRNGTEYLVRKSVSIPLEQGNVFQLYYVNSFITCYYVSIPLEQGNVFRQFTVH